MSNSDNAGIAAIQEAMALLKEGQERFQKLAFDTAKDVRRIETEMVKTGDLYDDKADEWYIDALATVRRSLGYINDMLIDVQRLRFMVDSQPPGFNKGPQPVQVTVQAQPPLANPENRGGIGQAIGQILVRKFASEKQVEALEKAAISSTPVTDLQLHAQQILPSLNSMLTWHKKNRLFLLKNPNKDTAVMLSEIEKDAMRKILNNVLGFLTTSSLYLERQIRDNAQLIATAVAQTVRDIYTTEVSGFSEEGFKVSPRGVGANPPQRRRRPQQ